MTRHFCRLAIAAGLFVGCGPAATTEDPVGTGGAGDANGTVRTGPLKSQAEAPPGEVGNEGPLPADYPRPSEGSDAQPNDASPTAGDAKAPASEPATPKPEVVDEPAGNPDEPKSDPAPKSN